MALLSNAAEKGPAIFTPDRYYMMPPTLTTEMHFAKGFQTYSFAQFDLQLNRPDIVLQRIADGVVFRSVVEFSGVLFLSFILKLHDGVGPYATTSGSDPSSGGGTGGGSGGGGGAVEGDCGAVAPA